MSDKATAPPKPPPRPRVEPGSTVSFWIRESAHDKLCKMAKDRRMTLSRFMASVVESRLR